MLIQFTLVSVVILVTELREQIKQRELFTSIQRQNQMMVMLHTLQSLNVQVTHLQQLRQQAQIQHQMIMRQQTAQIQQVLQQIQQAQA